MLKRYSFFGMTLELIAVLGVFFGLFVLIMLYAVWDSSRKAKRRGAAARKEASE